MLEAFTVPVILNCDPSNSKLALSPSEPPALARTTRPDVKSLTVAEDNILSPPLTFNPPRRVAA